MPKHLMPQDYIGRGVWFIHKGCICKQKVTCVAVTFAYDLKPFITKFHLEHYGPIDPCRCFETKTEARRHRKEDLERQLRSKQGELMYFEVGRNKKLTEIAELRQLLDKEDAKCSKQS